MWGFYLSEGVAREWTAQRYVTCVKRVLTLYLEIGMHSHPPRIGIIGIALICVVLYRPQGLFGNTSTRRRKA